jgi:hypothetical protein
MIRALIILLQTYKGCFQNMSPFDRDVTKCDKELGAAIS